MNAETQTQINRPHFYVDWNKQTIVEEGVSDFLVASRTPERDLELMAPSEQSPLRRQYRTGYEKFFERLPIFNKDSNVYEQTRVSRNVIQAVSDQIVSDGWLDSVQLDETGFARTIIGLESPIQEDRNMHKDGDIQLLVAHWKKGFKSPVHGHVPGYEHEEILIGRMRIHSYRMLSATSNIVRLVSTEVVGPGTFVSQWSEDKGYAFKRSVIIHNFVAVEKSHSLHYLPESTRDGKDNRFYPEYFEDVYQLKAENVTRISSEEAYHSFNGTVILVRSTNVPEYGDHYIVVTGAPVQKEHGLRPQDVAIDAPNTSKLLDQYEDPRGLILLKLNEEFTKAFHEFHGIKMQGNTVIMPEQESIPL